MAERLLQPLLDAKDTPKGVEEVSPTQPPRGHI